LKLRLGDHVKGLELLARAFEISNRTLGPEHSETLETRRDLALALVSVQRYDEAIPHLRAIVLRDLPPSLRIDMDDSMFDPMRNNPAFQALKAESVQMAAAAR
ncbi:MAG: tetratricopeptide repeat protein, partial [Bryobacteraceae bacterium]